MIPISADEDDTQPRRVNVFATMESDLVLGQVAAANRAFAALDEHLRVLLAVTDVLRVMGHEVASRELQHALMRAIQVLQVVRHELACLEIVENFIKRCQLTS